MLTLLTLLMLAQPLTPTECVIVDQEYLMMQTYEFQIMKQCDIVYRVQNRRGYAQKYGLVYDI